MTHALVVTVTLQTSSGVVRRSPFLQSSTPHIRRRAVTVNNASNVVLHTTKSFNNLPYYSTVKTVQMLSTIGALQVTENTKLYIRCTGMHRLGAVVTNTLQLCREMLLKGSLFKRKLQTFLYER